MSSPVELPQALLAALREADIECAVEGDDAALDRARRTADGRVRSVGSVDSAWRGHADIAVFDGAVTAAPELELRPFVREQAVSITAHRYGTAWDTGSRVAERMVSTGRL